MSYTPSIQIHNLYYRPPGQDQPLFKDINLTFGTNKIGLVGRNGVGKSTLLKLIAGLSKPQLGTVLSHAKVAMLDQTPQQSNTHTVAHIIGIQEKLDALERITAGSVDPNDYAIIGEDWNIEEQANDVLQRFNLAYLSLGQCVASLSGGELTRLHLIRVFMSDVDFILLDEPTNNLDKQSRAILYQEIERFHGGVLVVSHDRSLLRSMDEILELTTLGTTLYGGNYDHYIHEKALQESALERQYQDAKKSARKTQSAIQKSKEKHQQREKVGRQQRQSKSQAKVILDAQKERSGATKGKLSKHFERMEASAEMKLKEVKAKREITYELQIDLSTTKLPSNKNILELNKLCFQYDNKTMIIKDFNLKINGPERIAIQGPNGCGKSTLIKLITGALEPSDGVVDRKVKHIHYLDQHASLLNPNISVLENFAQFNSAFSEFECRRKLAYFLFRNKAAEKKVMDLSGGEKLRVLLACVMMASTPPQLIILDEPTNHLDLDSILVVEQALNQYQGALIVISHDEDLLNNIGITDKIEGPFV